MAIRQPSSWRWAVSDLAGETITFLDKLASNRTVQPNLNAPLELTGSVPSDSPEVNQLHTDNLPFLSEGVRQLYGFRRESVAIPYFRIRASTLILQTTDSSATGDARTTFTAWDPWQYLFYRPVYVPVFEGGYQLPGRKGYTYPKTMRADQIVLQWFDAMLFMADLTAPSAAQYAFTDWGWSVFHTGSLEHCADFNEPGYPGYHIEPGTSIGQAMQDMCATGVMDIVMTPIYDPVARPGILCDLAILRQDSDPDSGAGVRNYSAVFSWDRPGRSLVGFNDLFDGTQRANHIQYRTGTAGPQVTPANDGGSIAAYGEYWAQDSFPSDTLPLPIQVIELEQLSLRKTYKQTLTVNPASGRSPQPFLDYKCGDRVPIYIGTAQQGVYQIGDNSSRQSLPPGYTGVPPSPNPAVLVWQRVYGIPVEIDDNGVETVRELLVGPIGAPPPAGPAAAGGKASPLGASAAIGASGGAGVSTTRRGTTATTIVPFRGNRRGSV